MGQPPPFELGKTLGNIEGHLESIDNRLETGEKAMAALSTEQKKITECNSKMKRDIEKGNGRHYTTDEKLKRVDDHIKNPKIHFNPDIADEGAAGYIARNRLKITIITIITTALTIIGGLLIEWLKSMGG